MLPHTSNLHIVVGLGATGLSCVRYLDQLGIPVAVTDTRMEPPYLSDLKDMYPNVEASLGRLDEDMLAQAAKIVLSPGICLRTPPIVQQIKRGASVIGDIELFAQGVKVPVMAITGTNAKSTVTMLVGKMAEAQGLKVQVGGNLGTPALNLLLEHPNAELFVLELSSFQLETTYSLKTKVSTVLNITPDHMDRYQNFAEYQNTKKRIYQNSEVIVCNYDDPLTYFQHPSIRQTLYFSLNQSQKGMFGLRIKNNITYLAFENTPLLPTHELKVTGKHYQANALAALAMGYGFGFSMDAMLKALREFQGLPHRCQFVRELNQVKWYNDSKGTNVGATEAAIEGLGSQIEGKLILIAGGIGKNANFSPLVPLLEKYSRHVVLMGESAHELATVIAERVPISFAKSMEEAVYQAASLSKPHDSVLLSPACASFDMFKNFEHRGEVFMQLVTKL